MMSLSECQTEVPVPSPMMQRNQQQTQQQTEQVMIDDDPLLIAQTLTYVTDDGDTVLTFNSAPFSTAFKVRVILLEIIFVLLLICAVPIGAHGTVVAVSVANLILVAWFWYNLVRNVDITTDGTLRFWIGNISIDVPFDKIVSMKRVALSTPCSCVTFNPHRGFMSSPTDGVCIVTTVPSTPFWLWPRSAGKPDRTCCYGVVGCPRLTVVFSPAGGGLAFIREVENEMRNFSSGNRRQSQERVQPPSYVPTGMKSDYMDV